MEFVVKTLVFVLLAVEVFGRSAPIETDNESTSELPDGCPTPQCADDSCRIEIPPGHICPTCICGGARERNDFEPSVEPPDEAEIQNEVIERDNSTQMAPSVKLESGNAFEGENNENLDQESASNNEQGDSEDSNLKSIGDADSTKSRPRRKRQTAITGPPVSQHRWTILQQDQVQNPQDWGESDELERETSYENSEDYGGMRILKQGTEIEDNESNEISDLFDEESIIWEATVPGCPTPMCENSTCRIGILPGHQCPTCICRERLFKRQP